MRTSYKLLVLSLLTFFLTLQQTQAQDYKHSLGLRLGASYGLSYKYNFSPKVAFEGILATRYYGSYAYYNNGKHYGKYWSKYGGEGFTLTGLLEYHLPIPDVQGLRWYFGIGLHIGSWRSYYDWGNGYYDRAYFLFGIDPILGIEYSFKEVPIGLSLDYKPTFNLTTSYPRFWPDDVALTIRVLLDKL